MADIASVQSRRVTLALVVLIGWLSWTNNATAQIGACCNNTTIACTINGSSQCVASGGTFVSGSSCSPNPCPARAGACCDNGAGTCQTRLVAGCMNGQEFLGAGTSCSPNPCTGACCDNASGQCQG